MHISKLTLSFFSLALALGLNLQSQDFQYEDQYTVYQDLVNVGDDAVQMRIIPPLVQDSIVVFQMPKVVPGTYKVHNYGLFVRNFVALSAQGDTLPLKRLDLNAWQIGQAQDLYQIVYKIEDSFDSPEGSHIFPPSGSSNETEVFLLNEFAYIGYLRAYKNLKFELKVSHRPEHYGSTAWNGDRSDSLDVFSFPNYFVLHDNPLLYCAPDTASILIGKSKVELSVYSPNNKLKADATMQAVKEVLEASAMYLGGELPVDKYSILIYCEDDMEGQTSYGALEHHRSTVLYMPEMLGKDMYQSIRDIVAHEFLHIVTPLGIHSQYISDFDFADPLMSEHLWLYEGVTEYNSQLVQIRDGLYSLEDFIFVMRDKFIGNDQYEKIPLTVASRYTLDLFSENYQNFYEGGAIAAMALDLYLIEQSEGEMRLIDLLQKLRAQFPADTFFQDDQLFRIMAEMSYPQVEEFMVRHFEAGQPFPWQRLFNNVGLSYEEVGISYGWSLGCDEFSYDLEQSRFIIASEEGIDEFGEELGLELLDQIVSINGDTLAIYNFQRVLDDFQTNTQAGDEIEMVIARPKKNGEFKFKELEAEAMEVEYEESHQIKVMEQPSEAQLRLQNIWLNR